MMMTHSWEPLLFDQVMEKSDSNVEFMPDDEIISIYGDDDEEDASDRELFIAEGVVTDHVVDEYHTKVNKEDTHTIVSATTTKEVSFVFVTQSDPVSSPGDVKEIHITKEARSDPFGNLPQKMDFLAAQVHNLTKSIPNQFADKMNSVASSVPSLISHVVAQQLPNLLTLAIKYILPRALTNAVRETFFRFNMRIRTAIKGEMPANLTTSVLKLMYKEFNALKKLESKRSKIGEVTRLLKQCTIHQMQLINYMEQILHSSVKVPKDILVVNVKYLHTKTIKVPVLAQEEPQTADASDGQNSSALVVHSTTKEPPSKIPKVVMEIPTIPSLVPLNSIKPITVDNIPFEQLFANLAVEEGAMTLKEAKLQLQEVKRLADLKAQRKNQRRCLKG
ncbi:hypothetical protein Tco_0162938 [Tanacetum coccineum]